MALLVSFAPAAPAAAAGDPIVTVVVHVPLNRPHALAGGSWFCSNRRRNYQTPVPDALLRSYVRELSRFGSVRENLGLGTWMVGTSSAADLGFIAVDHIAVRTRLHAARTLLPPLLTRLRRDLDQREALGEIFGGAYGTAAQNRTKLEVVVSFAQARYTTLRRLNLIFGDRGRGGASQYADADGVHIYSSAPPSAAPPCPAPAARRTVKPAR
jgi:hypothetical protein